MREHYRRLLGLRSPARRTSPLARLALATPADSLRRILPSALADGAGAAGGQTELAAAGGSRRGAAIGAVEIRVTEGAL